MNDYDREGYMNAGMGIALPLIQAIISGLVAGLLTYALAMLTGQGRAGVWALTVGALTAAALWFASLRSWRMIVYRLEEYTQHDLDGNRTIGDPGEPPEPIRIEVSQNDGAHVDFVELPASQEQIVSLAVGLLNGATLSEAAWSGAGNIFTRAEFSQLRNELIKRGLAAWNNPRTPARGATLTPGGQAAMRYFASLSASNPPTLHKRV